MMLTFLIASTVSSGFTFKGGNMLDLCKAVHEYSGKPAFVSSFHSMPAVRLELKDSEFLMNNFHKLLPPKVTLTGNLKDDWAFQPSALAPYYFQDVNSKNSMLGYAQRNPTAGLEELTASNGIVSSKLGYGLIPLKDLGMIKFSKPVSVHWFLKEYRVAFALEKCDEKIFLSGLAKATCGRLVISKSSYSIEADPESFRRQWIGRLKQKKLETDVELRKERLQMSIEQLQQLTKKQLDSILEKPRGWACYQVSPKSQLYGRVVSFVKSYLDYCANHKEDTDCYIFSDKMLRDGGVNWDNGLRVQVMFPDIEFFLDKTLQFPGKPKYVVGF